jgi:uncharacterized phage-associated protein
MEAGWRPFDPRAIANLLLDLAERRQMPVTNLALQKLLYFAHALFLIEKKRPLLSGYFEAWQYGPVQPVVYKAFKDAGKNPITTRANKLDIISGVSSSIPTPRSDEATEIVERVVMSYGKLTPGRLIDIAHAKNAPWDYIVNKGKTSVAFGLRIPDNVIEERFKFHKSSVATHPRQGEPGEDSPLT